jgi:hypothetical protein
MMISFYMKLKMPFYFLFSDESVVAERKGCALKCKDVAVALIPGCMSGCNSNLEHTTDNVKENYTACVQRCSISDTDCLQRCALVSGSKLEDEPLPKNLGIVDSCRRNCELHANAHMPGELKKCYDHCMTARSSCIDCGAEKSGRVKKDLENPPVEKGQTRDVNEVCRQACASLQFKYAEYQRCMHSCFNYNQAFKKIESAPQKFKGVRQNRSVFEECKQKCVIRVAYKQCVESCMGGRDKKVEEEAKAVDVDFRQLSNAFDKCRNWCSPYFYNPSDYLNCVESCVSGNQGNRKLEDKSPTDIAEAEAEAPGVKDCIKRCIAAIGPLYKHCSVRCNKSHGNDIQEMLARKAPVAFSVPPSVPMQTINPGQFIYTSTYYIHILNKL